MGRVAEGSVLGKDAHLRTMLREYGSVIVAFSGGVDSAYLAVASTAELGASALCVTADSPSYPERHRRLALELTARFGLRHEIIHTGEMDRPGYRANGPDRCYHCKQELYTRLRALASARGFSTVVDGSNADDRSDYRPGRAAARELGVRSPLDEAGLGKAEIRELSRRAGVPVWNEPASACLSSRVPYYSPVTPEKLDTIEQAEAVLDRLGFQGSRVRHHDTVARIEVREAQLARALDAEIRAVLTRDLKALGFAHVSLDLDGYRTGSLNAELGRGATPDASSPSAPTRKPDGRRPIPLTPVR